MLVAPTGFFVFAPMRSGSSWLIDVLSSHPALLAYGELFHVEGGTPAYGSEGVSSLQDYVAAKPARTRRGHLRQQRRYLDYVYAPRPEIEAVGFKLVYGQAGRTPGLLGQLARQGARAVHLLRANFLESAVSFEVAKANGVFHMRRGEDVSLEPVRIDADEIRARLVQMERAAINARLSLVRNRLATLEVFYEELVQRREETLGGLLRFLQVDESHDLDSAFARSPGSIVDRIENLDEVCDALAGTRFEWMLGPALRRHRSRVLAG